MIMHLLILLLCKCNASTQDRKTTDHSLTPPRRDMPSRAASPREEMDKGELVKIGLVSALSNGLNLVLLLIHN